MQFFVGFLDSLRRGSNSEIICATQLNLLRASKMADSLNLAQFVKLGESVKIVSNPSPWHGQLLVDEIGNMLRQLTVCGMHRTRKAAEPLANWEIPYHMRSGFITPLAARQIESFMQPVLHALADEASAIGIMPIAKDAVSQRLREFAVSASLTETQKRLADETMRCLERGANRAAVVMGWCLGFDCVRYWAYSDNTRLATFNAELATYTKRNGQRQFDDIVNYDDFYQSKAPGEGRVLDTLEYSNLIPGRVARSLRHYLDLRNDYAHANDSNPSATQAIAFIEHLIDTVKAQPFLL